MLMTFVRTHVYTHDANLRWWWCGWVRGKIGIVLNLSHFIAHGCRRVFTFVICYIRLVMWKLCHAMLNKKSVLGLVTKTYAFGGL